MASRRGTEVDALVGLPGGGRAAADDLLLPDDGAVGAVGLGELASAGGVKVPVFRSTHA